MIREILRMGDPRLLQPSRPVESFGTPELRALLQDMRETMVAASGAGLAGPAVRDRGACGVRNTQTGRPVTSGRR